MSLENRDIASAIEAVRCDYPDIMRVVWRDIAEGDFSREELYSCIGHLLDKMYATKKVGMEHKIDPEDRDIYPSYVLVSLLEDIKNGDFTLLELHGFLERIYSVLKDGGFIMDSRIPHNVEVRGLDNVRYDGRTLTTEEAHLESKRSERFDSKKFLRDLGILDPYQSDGSDNEYHLATENEPSEFLRIGAEIGKDARVHYEGRTLSREEAILAEYSARHFDPEAWFKKHGLRYETELVRAMEEADAARRLEESEAGC